MTLRLFFFCCCCFLFFSFFLLKQAPAPQQSSNTSDSLFPCVVCLLILRALGPGSGSFPLPLLRPWEGWTQTPDRSGSRDRKAWCWRPEHVREANCHWGWRGGVLSPMKPFNGRFYPGKVRGNGLKDQDGLVWGATSSLFSSRVLATQDGLFDGWWFDRWVSFGWTLIFVEKMDSHLGKYVPTALTSVSRYPMQDDEMPWKQRQRGFWYNQTQR